MLFPDMVDHVGNLISKLNEHEQAKETDLIMDVTGTGRSVGILMVQSGLKPVRVTIAGGHEADQHEHNEWRIPKVKLVGGLEVTFQSDRLDMGAGVFEILSTRIWINDHHWEGNILFQYWSTVFSGLSDISFNSSLAFHTTTHS